MSKVRIPELKFHAPTNQHYVWWNKSRVHMGADPEAARARYTRWVTDLLAGRVPEPPRPTAANPAAERTVADVLVAYYRHARAYYAGQEGTLNRVWTAVDAARGMFADLPASQFRGPQLKRLREHLVAARRSKTTARALSRTYVNHLVGAVQMCWRWALSEDLVPAEAAHSLLAVERLRRGRGGREPQRILPPPADWAEALAGMTPLLAAMVQVQALGGMRPQDVCRMRRCELSTRADEPVPVPGTGRTVAAREVGGVWVWLYAPSAHKTDWAGKSRVIALGPRAQALLAPALEGLAGDRVVFGPDRILSEARRGNRYTGRLGACYDRRRYARLVERAIGRVNRDRAEPLQSWSPNQLRHLAATVVGDRLDRHHAAALLGHAGGSVIDTYMEQQLGKAARAAAECG